METKVSFRTSLKCSGCVARIKPAMDSLQDVAEWSVDLNAPEKVLHVTLKTGDKASVVKAVEALGYKIEEIK